MLKLVNCFFYLCLVVISNASHLLWSCRGGAWFGRRGGNKKIMNLKSVDDENKGISVNSTTSVEKANPVIKEDLLPVSDDVKRKKKKKRFHRKLELESEVVVLHEDERHSYEREPKVRRKKSKRANKVLVDKKLGSRREFNESRKIKKRKRMARRRTTRMNPDKVQPVDVQDFSLNFLEEIDRRSEEMNDVNGVSDEAKISSSDSLKYRYITEINFNDSISAESKGNTRVSDSDTSSESMHLSSRRKNQPRMLVDCDFLDESHSLKVDDHDQNHCSDKNNLLHSEEEVTKSSGSKRRRKKKVRVKEEGKIAELFDTSSEESPETLSEQNGFGVVTLDRDVDFPDDNVEPRIPSSINDEGEKVVHSNIDQSSDLGTTVENPPQLHVNQLPEFGTIIEDPEIESETTLNINCLDSNNKDFAEGSFVSIGNGSNDLKLNDLLHHEHQLLIANETIYNVSQNTLNQTQTIPFLSIVDEHHEENWIENKDKSQAENIDRNSQSSTSYSDATKSEEAADKTLTSKISNLTVMMEEALPVLTYEKSAELIFQRERHVLDSEASRSQNIISLLNESFIESEEKDAFQPYVDEEKKVDIEKVSRTIRNRDY
jgi:hypothetical protein